MRADPRFIAQSKEFWANVRTISQGVGYSALKNAEGILIPTLEDVRKCYAGLDLSVAHIANSDDVLTGFGQMLFAYFEYRATALWEIARANLMNAADASAIFRHLDEKLEPSCPLPMNKQKGNMRAPAFLTGLVNMLFEANIGDRQCDYDPQSLTTVTRDRKPLRTLARRVDGAFPSVVNPIGVWEVKEYYYTTSFGSRVAGGVYETLLDGLELEELNRVEQRRIHHLLIIDGRLTWWKMGRSYLCRMVDMLHMGYVDEVLFGREVVSRIPVIAREWSAELDRLLSDSASPEAAEPHLL